MAPGMRNWTLAALGGLLVVSVLMLPVGSWGPRPVPREPRPEAERALALQRELMVHYELLDRIDWLDATLSELRSARAEGRSLVLEIQDGEAAATLVSRLRTDIESDVAALAPAHADLVVSTEFLRPYAEGVRRWDLRRREYFIGTMEGRPYCILKRMDSGDAPETGEDWVAEATASRAAATGGFCGYVLRYDLPGTEVREWLRAGASARAMPKAFPGRRYSSTDARWGLSLTATACLAGRVEACADAFSNPATLDPAAIMAPAKALAETLPTFAGVGLSLAGHFGLPESSMIADLETEFGPERFGRFWTSDASVTDAFQEAFDVSTGEWVQGWVSGYYPQVRADAGIGIGTLWAPATVFFAGLLLGLFKARRREV